MTDTRLGTGLSRPVVVPSVFAVPTEIDAAAAALAGAQHGVISADQLVGVGVPETTVIVRARPGGGYTRVLPGVFRLGAGAPCAASQVSAALLYAGTPAAVVTGLAALHLYGVTAVDRIAGRYAADIDIRLHILVPHHVRRDSHGFVRIERTRYVPEPTSVRGVPVAPIARAIIDAGRCIPDVALLRPVVAEAMNLGLVKSGELLAVAATMPVRGSTATRQVVDEVSLGVETDAIEALRDAILRAGLPLPHFRPTLLDRHGCFLARVHGYRSPEGIAFLLADDLGSVEIAGSPARLADLRRTGVLVLSLTAAGIAADPEAALAPYATALHEVLDRPKPELRILRPPGGIGGRRGAGVV